MLRLWRAIAGGKLVIKGKFITINGLPLIFEQLEKKGIQPDNDCAEKLLETLKIYHAINAGDENEYREALVAAYGKYRQKRVK